MGSESPNAVLYDFNGNELAVQNNAAIPASTPALLAAGSDGTNSHYLVTDSTGRLIVIGDGYSTTSAPTYTNNTFNYLSLDTSGNLRVTGTFTSGGAADTTATGTLGALNATVQITLAGQNNAGITLESGTLIGTILPEVSLDGGTTWVSTFFDDPITSNITSTVVFASANTATVKTIVGVGGAGLARIRVSAYTSGSATCNLRASIMQDPSLLSGGSAGSALPPVVQQIGASVTTSSPTYTTGTLNALSLTVAGALRIDGSAVTQPVSGTVTSNQGTSPWVTNITQFGSSAIVTGTGASGAGIPRVTVSNDSNILATQSGTWTVQPGNTANTTPWLTTISQGGNSAVVKAGSTAAAAGDAALVIAPSPNTPTPRSADSFSTGTLGALNATQTYTTNGQSSAYAYITGTWVGTIQFYGTIDGTNFVPLNIVQGGLSNAYTTAGVTTNGGVRIALPASFTQIQAKMTAYTSGTATVEINFSSVPANVEAIQLNASNLNVTSAPSSFTTSGSISGNGNILQLPTGTNTITQYSGITLEVSGTWNSTLTLVGTNGGSYFTVEVIPLGNTNTGAQTTITSNGMYWAPLGYKAVELVSSGYVSGTVIVYAMLGGNESIPTAGQVLNYITATSYPDQGNYITSSTGPDYQDSFGNLQVRGPVLTDEGSFRTDFTTESVNSSFTTALTGTSQFVNGSNAVVGTGTSYQTQVREGQYIKLTADPEADYAQVASVNSNTSITLVSSYAGSSSTAATVVSNWATKTPPGGFGFGGANPTTILLASGTTANGTGYIQGLQDYGPISVQFYATIGAVQVNTTYYLGVQDIPGATPTAAARFLIGNSASATTLICETRSSANAGDISQTTISVPNNGVVTSYHLYKIDISDNQCTFSVDGLIVATSNIHLPQPYQQLYHYIGLYNGATAPAANQAISVDATFFEDIDRLQIDADFNGEPIVVAGNTTIAGSTALATIDSEHTRPTYFMSLQGFATGTTNQDVFNLIGSATKVIRVTRVRFSMTTTTAVTIPVQLIKRSTANTGGTGGVAVLGPYDSNDAAATATNFAYTANATTFGTVVGTAVRSDKYFALVATPTTAAQVLDWEFGNHSKCPTLRGTAQQLCINLGGVTIAGGNVSISFEWTEDYA